MTHLLGRNCAVRQRYHSVSEQLLRAEDHTMEIKSMESSQQCWKNQYGNRPGYQLTSIDCKPEVPCEEKKVN